DHRFGLRWKMPFPRGQRIDGWIGCGGGQQPVFLCEQTGQRHQTSPVAGTLQKFTARTVHRMGWGEKVRNGHMAYFQLVEATSSSLFGTLITRMGWISDSWSIRLLM